MNASVKSVVDGALTRLSARISLLEQNCNELCEKNHQLLSESNGFKKEIQSLKDSTDHLEQYSRRNSLRITGISNTKATTSTDDIVLKTQYFSYIVSAGASMRSWRSLNQYSAQYSFHATGCFPT